MNFKLYSDYKPAGDQPKAIEQITAGVDSGEKYQTLLGVTGSGKTFTMANVIMNTQKPTLIIAHNKTLAAQLCNEFREFFPKNAVEYFVSYYDYYQPEAYMPRTDTYIEKESQINEEIDRLRHSATQALLSRRDVIIVASVSCIYALGSPEEYKSTVLHIQTHPEFTAASAASNSDGPKGPVNNQLHSPFRGVGHDGAKAPLNRSEMLRRLTEMQFERTTADLTRGHFRARGDIVEVMPMNEEVVYRVVFEDEKVVDIQSLDPVTRKFIDQLHDVWIFPAKHYVVSQPRQKDAIREIRRDLEERLALFDKEGKVLEAERLSRRTRFDLEMIQNIGYCSGIENYSRHFDGRTSGQPPYTLIDYFPDDFLTIIDESHVTVSQIGGMYNGDKARKETLIEHGFRLPSAKDNRPLQFKEFEERMKQVVFVSATPGKYEAEHSTKVVEQIIRPTGLVDPMVSMRPVTPKGDYPGQVEDLMAEIEKRVAGKERALVTTLTKKMAEDLTEFLVGKGIKVQYLHSDVQTLDRITILSDLRKGAYDVVVGVNLLREGLDLPEVTLVAILDADKEGFLRSETSIIQTIGRAARNVKGEVIVYADVMTGSLERALKETNRRRKIQLAHNKKHGITPQSIHKEIKDIRAMLGGDETSTAGILKLEMTAEPHEIEHVIKEKTYEMKEAAKKLDFETATILRDEIALLAKELKTYGAPAVAEAMAGRKAPKKKREDSQPL
ncbi:MAG: excinuclease ABC subunit UvrB [Candidatus Uhrbacteria bacterium]|nr:excinuclease ABC subunit UvrB [Candidatus Uhrbacteria bacterium]